MSLPTTALYNKNMQDSLNQAFNSSELSFIQLETKLTSKLFNFFFPLPPAAARKSDFFFPLPPAAARNEFTAVASNLRPWRRIDGRVVEFLAVASNLQPWCRIYGRFVEFTAAKDYHCL